MNDKRSFKIGDKVKFFLEEDDSAAFEIEFISTHKGGISYTPLITQYFKLKNKPFRVAGGSGYCVPLSLLVHID